MVNGIWNRDMSHNSYIMNSDIMKSFIYFSVYFSIIYFQYIPRALWWCCSLFKFPHMSSNCYYITPPSGDKSEGISEDFRYFNFFWFKICLYFFKHFRLFLYIYICSCIFLIFSCIFQYFRVFLSIFVRFRLFLNMFMSFFNIFVCF